MKTIGKLIGYLLGGIVFGIGAILIFIGIIAFVAFIIAIPLYFLWNYMGSVSGFDFLPHLTYWNVSCLLMIIELLTASCVFISKILTIDMTKIRDIQMKKDIGIKLEKKNDFTI